MEEVIGGGAVRGDAAAAVGGRGPRTSPVSRRLGLLNRRPRSPSPRYALVVADVVRGYRRVAVQAVVAGGAPPIDSSSSLPIQILRVRMELTEGSSWHFLH
jgi:hypothetical protein